MLGQKAGTMHLSLSRLNHRLSQGEDEPSMMEGTEDVPHQSADAPLPEVASVFDAATALDTTLDMVDPQPTLAALLVRHVLLPRELLPQIEINSKVVELNQQWEQLWFPQQAAA